MRTHIMRLNRKRWLRGCIYILISLIILKLSSRTLMLLTDGRSEQMNDQLDSGMEDQNWLLNVKTSRIDQIPIVIVEEHYEVLKYWFQAADLDLIPKSRNILLHIDAHVDGAIPTDVDAIPWFRLPHGENEVYRMMQRNDMFIVAAAVTGFVDHVIWVWPIWDEQNHDDEDWTHIKVDVEVGITETKYYKGQSQKKLFLCACWTVMPESETKRVEHKEWKCHIRNTTCFEGTDCPEISKSQCMIQSHVVVEVVGESEAKSVLEKGSWPQGKGFILDIDEDYFGCWSDVIPLYEAGITQNTIDVLSELVSYLFCVSTAEGEILVDRFYVAILSLVKNMKSHSCAVQGNMKKGTRCLRTVEIQNFFTQREDEIIDFAKSEKSANILCESEEKMTGLFFQSLFHFLVNFSVEQLNLLERLGICLMTSPASPNFPADGKFHVCHGDNIPNRTLIPFYLPEEYDIFPQSMKLTDILTSIPKAPDIISVSRSGRDGYTPKSLFHLIESELISSISNTYRRVNSSTIHYDSNLLGGKEGWYDRSQPWSLELRKYLGVP